VSTTREALREFYQLHRRTRRRHGLPPQPFRFFQNIYDEIIGREGGFVVLARRGSRSIAAAVFFEFNGNAVYKFGASDESQQVVRANNLVMWEAIKRLADRGCRTLHFGRTELGNEGLRRFKQGWGAIEEVIPYFRFYGLTRPRPAEKKPSAFHTALFRSMPLPINGLAGALIYPHLD
jgi:lipid II:glycine glycyltransferase (peptidoglycan interpeptide bridge formation enzyme)